jgi:hypothetical protein
MHRTNSALPPWPAPAAASGAVDIHIHPARFATSLSLAGPKGISSDHRLALVP